MYQQVANCPIHNNPAYILCIGKCLNKQKWICDACQDHNKDESQKKFDPANHVFNEIRFEELKMSILREINQRPQKLQFILKGYHKIYEVFQRIGDFIQQQQQSMQEFVNDQLNRMKEDLKFISNLEFFRVNSEQAEQIKNIREYGIIDPSDYYKATLRRDLYGLIDLYKEALKVTQIQVNDYFQEKPLAQQNNSNVEIKLNTTCIAISHDDLYLANGVFGQVKGRLDIHELVSLKTIANRDFDIMITAVCFNQNPILQNFLYELAVCTKKYIQYFILNIRDKTLTVQRSFILDYSKYGKINKFLLLNQHEYIVLGEKLSYYQNSALLQPEKVIDQITVTDIDVSLEQERILIGNKCGYIKFQTFKQNSVYSIRPDQETQAHDRKPVICVKIRKDDKQRKKIYLTAGLDGQIKIWNFQSQIISQIAIQCNTVCFVGTSDLIAVFNTKEFEIGVFYEDEDQSKISYSRIKCKKLNFNQEYLKENEYIQNIGLVVTDQYFTKTIVRDRLISGFLDDTRALLRFQNKKAIQPMEISIVETQENNSFIRQSSIRIDFQKQV